MEHEKFNLNYFFLNNSALGLKKKENKARKSEIKKNRKVDTNTNWFTKPVTIIKANIYWMQTVLHSIEYNFKYSVSFNTQDNTMNYFYHHYINEEIEDQKH